MFVNFFNLPVLQPFFKMSGHSLTVNSRDPLVSHQELPIGQGWSCEGSGKEIFVDLSGAWKL